MMHDATTFAVLRLIHIVTGVFWVGTTVFLAGFLLPSMRAIGPAGGSVMEQLAQVRRLPLYMMAATVLAILSGAVLFWLDASAAPGAWNRSGVGQTFGLGGVAALIAAILGMAVNSPTGRRLGALAAAARARGGPPSADELAEMQRLQLRLTKATRWVALLLLVATAAMAVARYVR
jgi:uncharacterized membrane protein